MERITIIDEIRQKQLSWYGHVQKMEDHRLLKICMEQQPEEERKDADRSNV